MSEPIAKHSRMPRKMKPQTELSKPELPKSIANMGRLEGLDPKVVLRRYLSEESTLTIAGDFGVTRQALNLFLLKNAEEDWKDAQIGRALARKEKAEDCIDNATDPMQLAKGRELLKSAQWDLERVCRRIYGQDQNINFNLNVGDLGDRLRRARERIVNTLGQETAAA